MMLCVPGKFRDPKKLIVANALKRVYITATRHYPFLPFDSAGGAVTRSGPNRSRVSDTDHRVSSR
jgi:hypothetical protein